MGKFRERPLLHNPNDFQENTMSEKSLLTLLGETLDTYRANLTHSASVRHPPAIFIPCTLTLSLASSFTWQYPVHIACHRQFALGAECRCHLAGAPTSVITSITGIPYQGRLADKNGAPLTQTVNMTFRLYAAASGAPLWEEPWTGANSVQVSDGLFNVMLGQFDADSTGGDYGE